MDQSNHLQLTVCIPTFNRPTGLKRSIDSVLNQTYQNFKLIISDNSSSVPGIKELLEHYKSMDTRIEFYIQEQNIGASDNFRFLRSKVQTEHFIWLADDDYWSSNFLMEVVKKSTNDSILIFPNVLLVTDKVSPTYYDVIYGGCTTDQDYLLAWSRNGSGYPMYGLYNLKNFTKAGLSFEFDEDLFYYNEGTFLHSLFINGGVRCAPAATLYSDATAKSPSNQKLLESFFEYTKRVSLLYLNSEKLDKELKRQVLNNILFIHSKYIFSLCGLDPSRLQDFSEVKSFKSLLVKVKGIFKMYFLKENV